jgi:hypothetical protein
MDLKIVFIDPLPVLPDLEGGMSPVHAEKGEEGAQLPVER